MTDRGSPWTGRAVVRFLRRPWVVVAEVALFAFGAALAASLPQQPDVEAIRSLSQGSPALGRVLAFLGLHEILTSGWFLGVTLLCILSLVAVQAQQWPRLRRTWSAGLDAAGLARAPFRMSVPVASARARPSAPIFTATGRLGLLGSPIFHAGLLLLGLAGLVRLLTFRDVVGRAFEGDVIAASAGAFEAERGGRLSRPFALPRPLRVEEVREERYASGTLRQVAVRLRIEDAELREAAINAPLDIGDVRVYVMNAHGFAAFLRITGSAGPRDLTAFLEERGGEWRGGLRPSDGLELRFRSPGLERPRALEVRVLSGGVLRGVAELSPGASLPLGDGEALHLLDVVSWVQLQGSRDPSKPLFLAGLVVGILGVALMFSFNRVDTGVFIEEGRLVVALRPHRFAPLYADRFDRLCKEWFA